MTSNATELRGWSHSWVGRTSVVGTGLLALGGFTLSFAAHHAASQSHSEVTNLD